MSSYDATTALVVVDRQVDFGRPDGSLYVQGGEDVLTEVNAHVHDATAAGAAVFYTQDWHPPRTPHFATDGGIWPVHCVGGTPGAALLDGLAVAGPVVRKGTGGEDGYSGFSVRDPISGKTRATELEVLVRDRAPRTVVVVGLAGDYCVKETALDARRLGYEVVLPLAATRFVELTPGDASRAIEEMAAAGVRVERDQPSQ